MNEAERYLVELKTTWENELKPRIEGNGRDLAETKQEIDRIQDRMDELEIRAQRVAAGEFAAKAGGGRKSQERKDLDHFTRHGVMPSESKLISSKGYDNPHPESKVLAIRDESLGGVLAPPDFIAQVVQGIIQFSPIRALAYVRQTSRTSVQFPKRTGNFAAQWTTEVATRTETTGRTYGLDEIPTHELYARVLVSNWDLEDPVVDLEPMIAADMAEQFGVSEGAAFVGGSGVGRPEGLLSNPDVQNASTGNGGPAFTNGDGIIKMTFAIKEQYWPNARFVLNRFSLRDIRTLKDTTGNYLWQPAANGTHGLVDGLPATLYGYPYTIAVDMPSAASNAYTVLFGDFQKAYWVVDRIEMQYLRDPYSQASAGAVVLHARKRVGGQVVLPEAVNVLKMA